MLPVLLDGITEVGAHLFQAAQYTRGMVRISRGEFGIAAGGQDGEHGPPALHLGSGHLQPGHERRRWRRRVQAARGEGVGEVDAGALDPDQDLTLGGDRLRDLLDLQHLGSALARRDHRPHQDEASGNPSTKRVPSPGCDQSSQSRASWRSASSRLM